MYNSIKSDSILQQNNERGGSYEKERVRIRIKMPTGEELELNIPGTM